MKLIKICEIINKKSYNLLGDTLKKIFEGIGLISLACFSFFYTNQISSVIKENDDLLKQIKEIESQYKIEAIDAIIENDTIIPGINGSEIDVNKSYKKMKKLNEFNDNLLVYKTISPNVSVNKVYDKYIISGNTNKKDVSILFLVNNNDNINDIIKILDEYDVKATFYTDGVWFENNNELVIDLIENDHTIGNLGYGFNYDNSYVDWMNTIVTKVGNQKQTFCYNEISNEEALNACKMHKSYTIRPSIITDQNPLIDIKKTLKSGSIISLDVNELTIKQLPLIIEYINSRDLELVNIETLISEIQ